MFATLAAHEIRTMAVRWISVLAGNILVGVTSVGLSLLDIPFVSSILESIAIGAFISAPFVILIQQHIAYWQSMYGERGYFTMTLPATGAQVFWAKGAVSYLITLIATLVSIGGYLLIMWKYARAFDMTLGQFLQPILDFFDKAPVWLLIYLVIGCLISVASWVFPIQAIMSIGAQSRFNHLGFAAPVIGFIVYYVISQVTAVIGLILPGSASLADGSFSWQSMLPGLIDAIATGGDADRIGLGVVVTSLALMVWLVWWAIRSIDHHTSLR